jgi:peptidoglycan/LPS O-acetylase OafA/YrhL
MKSAGCYRLEQLTGLRFFAACLVFFSHLGLKSIFDQGYVGVSFFFVLSGFVLSLSYSDKLKNGRISKSNYILLRLARLSPLHYLTAAPFLIYAIYSNHFCSLSNLLNLLYLQSWIPNSLYYFSLNAPSWSLSNEMFFYMVFPFLIYLDIRSKAYVFISISFIVIFSALFFEIKYSEKIILFGQKTFSHWLFYIFPGFRLLEFLAGMIIFELWKINYFDFLKNTTWIAIPFLFISMFFAQYVPESFRLSLYYLPIVCFLLIAYLNTNDKNSSIIFFQSSLLVLLGRSSFAFYLTHQPIIYCFQKLFPFFYTQKLWCSLTLLLLCSLFSIALFLLYEQPFERFLKKKIIQNTSNQKSMFHLIQLNKYKKNNALLTKNQSLN